MSRSIENKIRFKAIVIYLIVAIGVGASIIYLNGMRRNIEQQRAQIANQRTLLFAVNELIFKVSEAQSFSSLYLSLKNKKYMLEYSRSLDSIEFLIDSIVVLKPGGEDKLRRVDSLLRWQARSIVQLNRQFSEQNPVSPISDRIEQYEPPQTEAPEHVISIRKDTVVSERPRKGFFKRFKEVFKPDRSPVKVAVSQRTDTIRTSVNDSLEIMREVGDIAQKAQTIYDRNIRTIERRVSRLIATDKEIASEISTLLLELHEETLESTLSMIGQTERRIDRNYLYSILGGVVALVLILVFIGLIITDINRGARTRRALIEANGRIRQVMESRHRLLLSVSHDIKSPLNSIMGYLGQMENRAEVQSMRNSSEHILSMLENLLEFSSLDAGTLHTSGSDFNLRELCREIYDMFLPLAQPKRLAFSFEADDVRINTDRGKLKQIVINLVSNSIKYTPGGEVRWSVRFDGGQVIVEVEDTGAGIPRDKLPELFEPFVRIARNNALAEGTGLGMYVVKGLTELLGGVIRIDSQVGVGTIVRVTIPATRARREIPQGMKRIRVVDDDPVIVHMLSGMLRGLGHEVVETDCELIITDLEMGPRSGLDVLREAGATPVVVMTGRAGFSAAEARAMGFDGYLAKPLSVSTLREMVGEGAPQEEMIGADSEEIRLLFRASAYENFGLLRQALGDGDYSRAQALCHKMYPMFAQLGYPTEELRRMDIHRDGSYEGWREDVHRILAIKV